MRARHEIKFFVRVSDVERFFQELSPFCDFDQHAGQTHSYEIASTYYDTSDLRFYVDRDESFGYRRKVRLRSYNTDGSATALFVEIKEKHKNLVNKKRINLKSMDILNLGIGHDALPLDLVINQLEDSEAAREIEYLHRRLKLYPVVMIRYVRKALIPRTEFDMRITLDTKITAGGHLLPKYDPDTEKFVCLPDHGVLEIKTNQSIPLWLQSILKKYDFNQVRYSKYCLGVDAMFGPERPWLPFQEKVHKINDGLEQIRQEAVV